ncbi:MAG: glycerol kinase GlpK [Brevibacterium sp.]|uniref:glycerol kinase GlpK n=1 Tax=Brevibacterium sp. TaxID=1701 RepID=UPI002649C7B7|nr:glycerol kinase GlpK [Brevibacterium sp.]MDN5805997.1 glycerol kinase GlpK [Brevibacterium sp.]MDN5833040.1 glycerol kinase GlpK [Brevibacterium sp.]MDN5908123.1 glycerol kinase GlpK [Brevibacterium sp.]MDN6133761.1 glycerol kinase GlpK [Brevibacterium sp.]MDN6158002.1 glycerol kinase GlpK [Brevibacterium sp.]
MSQEKYILAIDQGTTSSRAIVFDHDGQIVSTGQLEHEQIFPRAGWVEHDPMEIIRNTNEAIGQALTRADINRHQLEGVGITNQRETTVIWNKNTGKPVYNAIVWQDTRTQKICDELAGDVGPDKYKERVGLPLATYFAGPKAKWVFDNIDGVKESAEAGELLFGTMDTWVIWNLTGGVNGGIHVTDVTNASRTMLMNVKSLDWNEEIAGDMGIPVSMLPEIKSCSEVYGYGAKNGLIIDTPICGILGDQQAATFGQACFEKGQAKNTYGTGNFMLINTGTEPVASKNGLLTTVAYKIGDAEAVYALEGSIAVTGSLVQWLRDNLGIISEAPEVETLAKQVDDNGGCYIVPAFSGLFAPHWASDARGVFVGLTRFVNKNHIARAALESVAFQSREVLDAMDLDSGVGLTELKVDGGMVANETLMQFQADLLGVPVIRPEVIETTALGAAYAAGIAVKFWNGEEDVKANWREGKRWQPSMDGDKVARVYRLWNKAVEKSKAWVDEDVEELYS